MGARPPRLAGKNVPTGITGPRSAARTTFSSETSTHERVLPGLYRLVATCKAQGINPIAYLTDIIPRVQDHPKRRLDELLPGPWSRARAAD
ncbi:MAG: transposase domain-containing protein [Kofleriaceae bacterium]